MEQSSNCKGKQHIFLQITHTERGILFSERNQDNERYMFLRAGLHEIFCTDHGSRSQQQLHSAPNNSTQTTDLIPSLILQQCEA